MKISVVTVCLNSERTIARTIQSFLAQTWLRSELVIIDGGSTDRTIEIVGSFRDPRLTLHSGPDRGIYDAMNRGLELYRGDAVGFLNSDDAFHDNTALESIASGLLRADIVYGDLIFMKADDDQRRVRVWKAGPYRKGCFHRGWLPPHPTFYIRRRIADRAGQFDLRFGSAADYDFMLRALELGDPRVAYIPRTLVDFAHGGVSTKGLWTYIRGNYLCLRSRREHLRSPPLDLALVLKPLRKLHQLRPLG